MITGGANDHDDNGKKEEKEDENDEEEDDDEEEEDDDEEEDCCTIHYISQLKEELVRYLFKMNNLWRKLKQMPKLIFTCQFVLSTHIGFREIAKYV